MNDTRPGRNPRPHPSGKNTPHQSSKPAAARPCRRFSTARCRSTNLLRRVRAWLVRKAAPVCRRWPFRQRAWPNCRTSDARIAGSSEPLRRRATTPRETGRRPLPARDTCARPRHAIPRRATRARFRQKFKALCGSSPSRNEGYGGASDATEWGRRQGEVRVRCAYTAVHKLPNEPTPKEGQSLARARGAAGRTDPSREARRPRRCGRGAVARRAARSAVHRGRSSCEEAGAPRRRRIPHCGRCTPRRRAPRAGAGPRAGRNGLGARRLVLDG